jgi:hypothetical protein
MAREPEEDVILMTTGEFDWRRYGKAACVRK